VPASQLQRRVSPIEFAIKGSTEGWEKRIHKIRTNTMSIQKGRHGDDGKENSDVCEKAMLVSSRKRLYLMPGKGELKSFKSSTKWLP